MSGKVFEQHWLTVLKAVVTEPMQKSLQYAYNLKMKKGTCVYVLIQLEKQGFVGQYNYTVKNVYQTTHRYYYATDYGHNTILAFRP